MWAAFAPRGVGSPCELLPFHFTVVGSGIAMSFLHEALADSSDASVRPMTDVTWTHVTSALSQQHVAVVVVVVVRQRASRPSLPALPRPHLGSMSLGPMSLGLHVTWTPCHLDPCHLDPMSVCFFSSLNFFRLLLFPFASFLILSPSAFSEVAPPPSSTSYIKDLPELC